MVGQPASTVWAAMRRNTKNKKEKNGVQALAMLGILSSTDLTGVR